MNFPAHANIVAGLKSGAVSMALGSLVFQGATFCMLMLLKGGQPVEKFADIVVQIAGASVLGAVATFRLELLLFQERGCVDRPSLLSVFAFSLMFLPILAEGINESMYIAGQPLHFTTYAVVLALGLGLHETQSFLCVQLQRVPQLLVTRSFQGAGILYSGVLGWNGAAHDWVFGVYSLSVTAPLMVWMIFTIWQSDGEIRLILPQRNTWKRGFALAASSLVNTLYTSIGVLVAAATQAPTFVADFGFIIKILAGPITTIRQAFGHTYMKAAFAIDKKQVGSGTLLWQITWDAILRSIAVYLVILICVTAFLFATTDLFGISRSQSILWLSAATIAQVGVNTVSGIRTPLRLESPFLGFDILRTTLLLGALVLPLGLPFDVMFAVMSCTLYFAYILFIKIQIASLPR